MLFAQLHAPATAVQTTTQVSEGTPTAASREGDQRTGDPRLQHPRADDQRTGDPRLQDPLFAEPAGDPRFAGAAYGPVAPPRQLHAPGADDRPGVPLQREEGWNWALRLDLVEGFNDNTYQTRDSLRSPIVHRHPALVTGEEGYFQLQYANSVGDGHTLRIGGRTQQYIPLDNADQPADGAVTGAWTSRHTFNAETTGTFSAVGALMTLNALHLSDGVMFAFDPTATRRTFWATTFDVGVHRSFGARWRYHQGVGASYLGTISEPPQLLPDGRRILHHGVDSAVYYTEGQLAHDFNVFNRGGILWRYQHTEALYVIDASRDPPANIGPQRYDNVALLGDWGHTWTTEWSSETRVGVTYASPPPTEVDQRWLAEPTAGQEVSYHSEYLAFTAGATYVYGPVNPRLGSGPTYAAQALLAGVPSIKGRWRHLSLVATTNAIYTKVTTGRSESASVTAVGGGFQTRYALGDVWGIIGGYDARYVRFGMSEQAQALPPFYRHLVYVGVSAYFTTDRNIPAIGTVFTPANAE